MIQKSLVFIILLIVFYDIYINNQKLITKVTNKTNDIIINKPNIVTPNSITTTQHQDIDEDITQGENELRENIDPELYGKPADYVKDKYILWDFRDPNPWSKIVYKYNDPYPFYFFIKVKISSLNDYNNWKNIITNLDFDPKTGELILPTQDEESALAIINLILVQFKGDLSMEDIISKNLIDISINKIKKYDVVKNKIKEQIIINTNSNIINKIAAKQDITNTSISPNPKISIPVMQSSDFLPYDGSEFSFI
jgi:hypothetical protein